MALAIQGAFVVQVASATAQATTDSFGTLKICAARCVKGTGQASVLEEAGEGIKRAIDDLNMRDLFTFGSETAADVDLTSGTATYSLAANFFAVRDVQLINSDADEAFQLEYVDWDEFNERESLQSKTGRPEIWTARNSFSDENIRVYPEPDASAATDYDLRITYYKRIARPVNDSDVISAPRELSDLLCTYAEYYILFNRDGDRPHRWRHKLQHYSDKLDAFRYSVNRQPAATNQWSIAPEHGNLNREFDPLG